MQAQLRKLNEEIQWVANDIAWMDATANMYAKDWDMAKRQEFLDDRDEMVTRLNELHTKRTALMNQRAAASKKQRPTHTYYHPIKDENGFIVGMAQAVDIPY